MADAQALDHVRREYSRRKGSPEQLVELRIEAADAQPLEVELLVFEQLGGRYGALLAADLQSSAQCSR